MRSKFFSTVSLIKLVRLETKESMPELVSLSILYSSDKLSIRKGFSRDPMSVSTPARELVMASADGLTGWFG